MVLIASLLCLIALMLCTSCAMADTIASVHEDATAAEMLQATKKWLSEGRLTGRAAVFGAAAAPPNIVHLSSSEVSTSFVAATIKARPDQFGAFPTATSPKIFGIGLAKTGTTSLHTALQSMGLRCIHFDVKLMHALAHRWRNTSPDLSGWYDDVDCVSDIPTAAFFEELLAAYPNAKFVATHREVSAWYPSFAKFLGIVESPLVNRRLRERVFGSVEPDEKIWTKSYIHHYQRIKTVIPEKQLLWLDMNDLSKPDFRPFARVCDFLSIPSRQCLPPDTAWPRANSFKELQEKQTQAKVAQDPIDHIHPTVSSDSEAPITSEIIHSEYAYVTFLSGADKKSDDTFRSQYLTASMVWCQSIRGTYSQNDETRKFDMVLLSFDSELSQSRLHLLRTCFDRVIITPVLGRAASGTPDTPYWSTIRSKLAVFSLSEYRRVIAMDADHVVVKNLDAYFFRWFYDANERKNDKNDIERAIHAARDDAVSEVTSTPRMLYAVPHTDFPIDTNFLSLQPSQQIMHDLHYLLEKGNFNRDNGWNNYGPVSTPDPSSLWAPKVSLTRAPQLHVTPNMYNMKALIHPWHEVSGVWHQQCAWADVGLTLYYFYLLTPELGGFVNPEDAQQSFIHYHGSNKPWMHTPDSMRTNVPVDANDALRKQAAQWADAVGYWQELAAKVEALEDEKGGHDSPRKFNPAVFQKALSEDIRKSVRFQILAYGSTNPVYSISPTLLFTTVSSTKGVSVSETTSCATDIV